jgi:hypothetical protein
VEVFPCRPQPRVVLWWDVEIGRGLTYVLHNVQSICVAVRIDYAW